MAAGYSGSYSDNATSGVHDSGNANVNYMSPQFPPAPFFASGADVSPLPAWAVPAGLALAVVIGAVAFFGGGK